MRGAEALYASLSERIMLRSRKGAELC
jgi:hypothetical protein